MGNMWRRYSLDLLLGEAESAVTLSTYSPLTGMVVWDRIPLGPYSGTPTVAAILEELHSAVLELMERSTHL